MPNWTALDKEAFFRRYPEGRQYPVVPNAPAPLWVGLVDAAFDDGPDELGMVGAFVWAMCSAGSADDFERRVTVQLSMHGATPLEFNEVEPLDDRMQRERLSRDLRRLSHDARAGEVAFGTWHQYPEDDG